MPYSEQDTFFAQAYRTGTDNWTTIPFTRRAHELAMYLPKGSLVLDLGTGRGRLLFDLANLGLRAIGIENNNALVSGGNSEVKNKNLDRNLRFLFGSVLDIPLSDESFDAVADIGLLHHIAPSDYAMYASEVARVLKQDGLFFLVVLSKNTAKHFSWQPSKSDVADFEREGVQYHFFSDEELTDLFKKDFEIVELDHDMPYGPNETIFTVVLLKKK